MFLGNDLPKNGSRKKETAIINLDDKNNIGSNWTCFAKINNRVNYFDSFGNLKPPKELVNYFGHGSIIKYNHDRIQDFNTYECGHLCLKFLYNMQIFNF